MVKTLKNNIIKFCKLYKMHYHFLVATVLFASKNIFFNLLCKISQITADQPFIYNLTKFTSNLFLFTIWFFILFTSTRRKSYFYKTGRNFRCRFIRLCNRARGSNWNESGIYFLSEN